MVKKVAQRAIAAGLAGMMSLGAFAPAAMAIDGTSWDLLPWWNLTPTTDDDGLTFWKRIKGDTRYDTMKKILEAAYTSDGRWVNAAEAVIASGDNFPDALAANGLAGTLNNGKGAPVILTKRGALSSQAREVLEKMQVQHVYIMGGTSAVSQEVEDAIAKMKIATTRVAGADRQETSMKAFDLVSGNWYKNYGTHSVIIATGANYADALSIAPFAYQTGTPIMLTKADGNLTQAQIDAIKDNEEIYNIIVVGGDKVVSTSAFGLVGTFNNKWGFNYTGVRIDGADRYETSANIADWEVNYAKSAYNRVIGKDQGGSTLFDNTGVAVTNVGDCYFDWDFTFVATGENFPDALAGAQLAGGSYQNSRGTGYIQHANKQNDRESFISGSPILLTKDGDRTAEMVIARNLAWNTNKYYTKGAALYANWFDLNRTKGMTPQEFAENYLSLGFFSVNPMVSGTTSATTGYTSNWAGQIELSDYNGGLAVYNTNTGEYIGIIQWAVENGKTPFTRYVIGADGKIIGTINAAGDVLTYSDTAKGTVSVRVSAQNLRVLMNAAGDSIIGRLDDNDNAGPDYNILDVRGNIIGTVNGIAATTNPHTAGATLTVTYHRSGDPATTTSPAQLVDGRYVYGTDAGKSIYGITNASYSIFTGTPTTGTFQYLDLSGDRGVYEVNREGLSFDTIRFDRAIYRVDVFSPSEANPASPTTVVNPTADIYVFNGIKAADSNFHGIIFGGTAAVSKDKAKELDKAVKNTIKSDVNLWEWDFNDRPSSILNTTLLNNTYWAYREDRPISQDGVVLNHFYSPALPREYYANYTNSLVADLVIDYAKYFDTAFKDNRVLAGNGLIYNSRQEALNANQTIVGKVGTMDFYHFAYAEDPVTRVKTWVYDGTETMNFVVDMNTGVMTALPWFA